MGRRKPLGRQEAFEARRELCRAVEEGRVAWSDGVRRIRRALGMTQAELATAFDLTVRQVSELESGRANPTVATLARVAEPFGFTVGFVSRAPRP